MAGMLCAGGRHHVIWTYLVLVLAAGGSAAAAASPVPAEAPAQAIPTMGDGGPLADTLKIDSGLVSGATAGEKKDVRVYRGIPFSAPPAGPLRWKPPQPVRPWDGVRACTEFGPWCPQPAAIIGGPAGRQSEDCLYLNVWTAARRADEKRPVMVWIHGGGCTTGSGGTVFYDGEALARQGVVLVTINYRLGPLGFLAHPLLSKESHRRVSGNYGMMDQIEALRWIQRNVAAFGGDPGCVTIFGESAGGASVCRLMVSPPARGLFHRAIAESGTIYSRSRWLKETRGGVESAEALGERVAARLGCDKEADPLAAMRAKTPQEVLKAADPMQGLFGSGTKWVWVVDGWLLPDDPATLFAAGKQAAVPLVAGSNADEGTIFLRQLPVRHVAGYELTVRSLFAPHGPEWLKLFPAASDDEVPAALDHLVTAVSFAAPARAAARDMEKAGAKAYVYHFTRVPPVYRASGLGAFHGGEIPYVFGHAGGRPGFEEKDRELAKVMSGCWVRFAATGNPNGPGLPEWPAYTAAADSYLEFGDAIKIKSGLYKEACDLTDKTQAERMRGKAAPEGELPMAE